MCKAKNLTKILRFILSGDQEKKLCRILQTPIFWYKYFKGTTQGSPDLSKNFEGKV